MVGEDGDGAEHERSQHPSRSLEGVGKAEDAGADDGDEDVGEGLGLGGEGSGFEQWGVFSGERIEAIGGGACFVLKPHLLSHCFPSQTPKFIRKKKKKQKIHRGVEH